MAYSSDGLSSIPGIGKFISYPHSPHRLWGRGVTLPTHLHLRSALRLLELKLHAPLYSYCIVFKGLMTLVNLLLLEIILAFNKT
jgi:hypothetical protein